METFEQDIECPYCQETTTLPMNVTVESGSENWFEVLASTKVYDCTCCGEKLEVKAAEYVYFDVTKS